MVEFETSSHKRVTLLVCMIQDGKVKVLTDGSGKVEDNRIGHG